MAMMSSDNKNHGALNAACPVCGSDFTNGLTARYQGTSYEMCSVECFDEFNEDPEEHVKDG